MNEQKGYPNEPAVFVIPTKAEGSDRGFMVEREILNQVQNDSIR